MKTTNKQETRGGANTNPQLSRNKTGVVSKLWLRVRWFVAQRRAAWLIEHPTCKFRCDGFGDVDKVGVLDGESALVCYAFHKLCPFDAPPRRVWRYRSTRSYRDAIRQLA